MTDTDLIVPIEVHALLATRAVNEFDDFRRWTPKYPWTFSELHRSNAEPPIQHTEGSPGEGIHVQWQLPEALTTGAIDPETGVSTFPLVPNRWLVVRYAQVRGELRAAGFLVHSDYLEKADGGPVESAFTPFVDPASPAQTPRSDYIGRVHPLTDGPWQEPAARPLFLTAIGSGLPAFAAFAPYHQDVFLFHDTLADLKANDNYPPPCTVSYCVIGWYSRDGADILTAARDIEGLLPPDADPDSVADVLAALGWAAPEGMPSTIVRTRYAGTALGIPWDREGGHPESDRPVDRDVKVAIGHSTADAVAALAAHQTRSARTGDLVRALFDGNPDILDEADWQDSLDEITRRAWFSGHDGGAGWQVVNRPSQDPENQAPPPEQPAWITTLGADQESRDTTAHRLASAQWRLWTLWWLRHLPADRRPHGFEFDAAAWDRRIRSAQAEVADLQREADRLRLLVPQGLTPEELQAAIDRYAQDHGLPEDLELKRAPRQSYYRPADPVLALTGSGTTQPLGRDEDDPLPCRLPSRLLTRAKINDTWVNTPGNPLLPVNMTGLPQPCTVLLAEFALLDQAVRAQATGGAAGPTALHAIVADPSGRTEGPWPEYTRPWHQPWLPLYIQWEVKHCATAYRSSQDTAPHWEFDGDRYRWKGTAAAEGDGEGGRRWTAFGARAFVTPATRFVLREQARRLAESSPPQLAGQLHAMREELEGIEVLSQALDGFHDWLVQQDGAAQAVTDRSILASAGETNHVPDGAEGWDTQRFQPVRGGQFYFVELVIIDRFGRVCSLVQPNQTQPIQFAPIRADSLLPDRDLFPEPPGRQRFIQLPPRLIQPTRLRLETVPLRADQPPAPAVSGTAAGTAAEATTSAAAGGDTPVAGWLLVNHLDRTLLVYGPDGEPLGELRVVRDVRNVRTTAWNALPHAPHRHPSEADFTTAYPHVAAFALGLLNRQPAAFEALTSTIDTALDHIVEPSGTEDRSPARLIGRPVALIRARLGMDLMGDPLTDPGWQHALDPEDEDYPDHRWTVRLGDPDQLSDGLIGYFAAADHDQPTRYDLFHAVDPDGPASTYVTAIGTGAHLTVPARPADRRATHQLTLLACPHTAVHATTDLLPVAEVGVDADTTHRALTRIRASFRLNPLLAPDRFGPPRATASRPARSGHPASAMADGDPSTYYESEEAAGTGDWVRLDLHLERTIDGVHLLLGRPDGTRLPGATDLEASTDGQEWTLLQSNTQAGEVHYQPQTPFTARYLRLRHTGADATPYAVRAFTAQAEPLDPALVLPRPAAWHGTWTWAQPLAVNSSAAGLPLPDWDEHAIFNADQLSHPDAPLPVARSGYLQLQPAALTPSRSTPAPATQGPTQ
ncbi:discoidin domain-containing protein [Kitasatospora sp. NPDC094011]|uniref:discoidin domain-containing protein n=1 Tax=Kitasatospora sp. NPDC094011 TaxID=3364090 RepID=UPI00382B886E